MDTLENRIKQRKERETERLKSGVAMDPNPSDHAGEAQDPNTFENLGDGRGPLASTGASGALGNPVELAGDAQAPAWPKPAGDDVKTNVKGGSGKKDPTA